MSRPRSPRSSGGSSPRSPRRNLNPGDAIEPVSGLMPESDLIPDTLRMMAPKELATMRMVSVEYRNKVDSVVKDRIKKANLVDPDGNPVTSTDWPTFGRWMNGTLTPYDDYLVEKWDREVPLSKAYAPEVQVTFVKNLLTPLPDATPEETANTHEELHKYTSLLLAAGRVVRSDNTPVAPTTPTTDVLTNISEGTMRFLPKPPP